MLALPVLAAKDRGGTFGIGVDDEGYVLESCVLNVVLVGADGTMRTPPFCRLLNGTTVRRAMELAKASLVPPHAEHLAAVSQERLRVDDLTSAKELFLLAGDTHVFSITSLNGKKVGDGRVGPVCREIERLLREDAEGGAGVDLALHHEPVPGLATC